MTPGLRRSGRAIASLIGVDERALLVALVVLVIGAWQVWRPAAWLIPGLVLLWIFLPQRTSFIQRSDDKTGSKR